MDPIANLLTKIRNAQKASHESVTVPHSKIKEAIAKILQKEGFVGEVKVMTKDQFPEIKIMLKEGQELELTKVSKS
ncbi:MAG: 30S ribosomal protein S8, partial [Patescibacteria group bacterium]